MTESSIVQEIEEYAVKHDAFIVFPLIWDSSEIVDVIVHSNEIVLSRGRLKQRKAHKHVVITSMCIFV